MREAPITKDELKGVIRDWGEGRMTSKALHDWCEENYWPGQWEPGPDEPLHVGRAMAVILNEFELSDPASFSPKRFGSALSFLETAEADFERAQQEFLENCFQEVSP